MILCGDGCGAASIAVKCLHLAENYSLLGLDSKCGYLHVGVTPLGLRKH